MMRNVYLEGSLGEKFGKKFTMEASSMAEVLKCLQANRPEFKKFIVECIDKNIDINIKVHDKDINEDELLLPLKEGDITLCIVPSGSKKGVKVLLAIAIIIYAPQELFFQTLAVNLALTGLQEMMAPDPATDAENEESKDYLFSGSQHASKQKDPVPVLYGELRVPGRVADFHIRNGIHLGSSVIIDAYGNITTVTANKMYTAPGEA